MQLVPQILQKCQQDRWFGTDSMRRWHAHFPKADEPLTAHFQSLPATEADMRATEAILGFALPHELRSLYLQVANGGFGPDLGLIGVTNGCSVTFLDLYPMLPDYAAIERVDGLRLPDVYRLQVQPTTRIDFADDRATALAQGWVNIAYPAFPQKMCTFAWALGLQGYTIDAETGAIYRCEGISADEYRLTLLAPDLHTWLQPWLDGTWTSPYTERMAQLPAPRTRRNREVNREEHEKAQQRTIHALAQARNALHREPRHFVGLHADILQRIYQRCQDLGGVIYPTATAAQVLAAEERLGQPFPSLLQQLYLQVANGGFGPYYGLYGVDQGYPYQSNQTIVESLTEADATVRSCDVSEYEKEIQRTGAFIVLSGGPLPYTIEPRNFICLSDNGCCLSSWLHLDSLRVFESAFCSAMGVHYKLIAPSLESWFEAWLVQTDKFPQKAFESALRRYVYSYLRRAE